MRTQYYIEAICPKCGKEHNNVHAIDGMSSPWTGTCKPRLLCLECLQISKSTASQGQYRKFTKRQATTFLGMSVTRGINAAQKIKHDIGCELEGRKFREKWGIVAPAHYWYVKDKAIQ